MRIWVDADACPGAVKEILFRAARKREVEVTLVANQLLRTPPSRFIRSVQAPKVFDGADHRIVELAEEGDLVITADVPLAARVVENGGLALNPRGELYTEENIGEHLAMRDLADELRSGGVETGGPRSFGPNDRQAFANRLDRILTQREGAS